jgi:vancomycin resistance protein YoaR
MIRRTSDKTSWFIKTYGVGLALVVSVAVILAAYVIAFERQYANLVYPNVTIGGIPFGGKTYDDVVAYWNEKNAPLHDTVFTLTSGDVVATISGTDMAAGYDAKLGATQAYLAGRSEYTLSNIREKYFRGQIDVKPVISWDKNAVASAIDSVRESIEIPVQEGLFQFTDGKVTAFKPSAPGRIIDRQALEKEIDRTVTELVDRPQATVSIAIPVKTIEPDISTDKANNFGIKERIGKGYSEFAGSIAGRIHNVALGSSKLNGVLIAPGETFSFNKAVGDISAATGYQSAYIIKDGRTVLGDGGGICQVSTTLFRAAMDAGLPIVERHEHSYRVHYYEEGGFKAGMDATVFSPSDDFKFLNNTPAYILIQTTVDTDNLKATFELFGTNDGRKSEIYDHIVYGESAPPPDLYQDDPTLPVGVVKQVDFAAWGAKASFKYRVTRNGQPLTEQTFTSNYRPWQAVYLKGTKQ